MLLYLVCLHLVCLDPRAAYVLTGCSRFYIFSWCIFGIFLNFFVLCDRDFHVLFHLLGGSLMTISVTLELLIKSENKEKK